MCTEITTIDNIATVTADVDNAIINRHLSTLTDEANNGPINDHVLGLLQDLTASKEADTEILTSGNRFYAHSFILKARSIVLREELTRDEDDFAAGAFRIDWKAYSAGSIEMFLNYICKAELPTPAMDVFNASELYELADQYCVEQLRGYMWNMLTQFARVPIRAIQLIQLGSSKIRTMALDIICDVAAGRTPSCPDQSFAARHCLPMTAGETAQLIEELPNDIKVVIANHALTRMFAAQ